MTLSIDCAFTAMAAGLQAYFLGVGGVGPYTYSVISGGAGGSIDSSTGLYTAPLNASDDPSKQYDTIQVIDSDSPTPSTATFKILITDALGLVIDIIQSEMGLANGRVYLYNQKIMQPKDNGVYIALAVMNCKVIGNSISMDGSGSGLDAVQSVNMMATLNVDIISRDISALRRKEEVLIALNSIYAQQQQELNSFYIAKMPPGAQFLNLSNIDGAAIPYRFNITINIQYFVKKQKSVSYYDQFSSVQVTTEA